MISSFIRLDNPHAASLKLMSLEMDSLDFHFLEEVCSCKGLRQLEYLSLKPFYHMLLKNAVKDLETLALPRVADRKRLV